MAGTQPLMEGRRYQRPYLGYDASVAIADVGDSTNVGLQMAALYF
jgi:hypothetical protein